MPMASHANGSDQHNLLRLHAVSDVAWDEMRRLLDVVNAKGDVAGVWRGGNAQRDGAIVMPWVDFDEDAWGIVQLLYDTELIVEFGWSEWLETSGYTDGDDIPGLPIVDIVRLVTAMVRVDRFSEGAIFERFSDGTLPAAIHRLLDWHSAQTPAPISADLL